MEEKSTPILNALDKTNDYLEKTRDYLEETRLNLKANLPKAHRINHMLFVILTVVAYSYDKLSLAETLVLLVLLSIRFRLSSGFKG